MKAEGTVGAPTCFCRRAPFTAAAASGDSDGHRSTRGRGADVVGEASRTQVVHV
jgi:hypothetical protein